MTETYTLITFSTGGQSITRGSDGASIPLDSNNSDYRAYLSWVALGNTPTEQTV